MKKKIFYLVLLTCFISAGYGMVNKHNIYANTTKSVSSQMVRNDHWYNGIPSQAPCEETHTNCKKHRVIKTNVHENDHQGKHHHSMN